MKEIVINDKINKNIEGSMLISLLNRIQVMDVISNATYVKIKQKIIKDYKLKLE